ncbi:MAG: heterodisulfide reductase-related iron-sulfur binding cluster, partial [Methanothrix sp.]
DMTRSREFQRCCGAGGGVKAGIPDLALDCAKARLDDADLIAADIIASTCPFCRRNIMDGRAALTEKSDVKIVDVVEMMAAAMGLDTAIPDNPYMQFQEQDVIVCEEVCEIETVERKAEGKDLVGEAH